jgi:polysaccharide pyruvyl transferase CsaB
MGTKKILISGYYGFDNSGDDAILRAIVNDLNENIENIEITALSKEPNYTKEVYKINVVDRFSIKAVIRAIKSCDLFISGGGSLLQDVTSTRSLLYYISLMRLAKHYNKKVMVYANGVGPIDGKMNRILTRRILNRVDLITLRDEDSRVFLEELKVKNENIFVTADPVFTLNPTNPEKVLKILEKESIPNNKPLVGISLRDWKDSDNLIVNIAKSIDYIVKKHNANVLLIPMHYPEDLEIGNRVLGKTNNNSTYILSNKYSVEDIMGIIKNLEMIIAMRLHSLIYAASQGTPMVGIVYDPKIEGFLKSINMDYMCPAEGIEYQDLIEKIDMVWDNRGNYKESLVKVDQYMKKEALKNTHMAKALLEK